MDTALKREAKNISPHQVECFSLFSPGTGIDSHRQKYWHEAEQIWNPPKAKSLGDGWIWLYLHMYHIRQGMGVLSPFAS